MRSASILPAFLNRIEGWCRVMSSRRSVVRSLPLCLLASAFAAGPAVAQATSQADGRVDLLSWGAGAFAVRLDPPAPNATVRVAIDGDLRTLGIGIPRREPLPQRFVVELPALTTFDTFVIPEIDEFGPQRGRHVRTVEIEGSLEGPESGFSALATLTVEMDRNGPQSFPVPESRPVRWVRVTLVDRLLEAPADFDPHTFAELIGLGTQEEIVVPHDRFTGRWRLRRTGINDVPGTNTVELIQEGTSIRGCQILGGQQARITGAVVDGLAQLVADAEGAPAPAPMLVTVTAEGDLVGARFVSGFSEIWASPDADAETVCTETPEVEDPIAGALLSGDAAVIHGINFDVDSDVLRSDATPALERVLAALQSVGDLSVVIEGHTDSDGSDEHNLDLSQRRAEAVVAWLVERGITDSRLRPVGLGEAQPIADNDTSAGRALNRRVEVRPE